MKSIKLIIFDCDGTLVDSEYLYNLAIVELLREGGIDDYSTDDIARLYTGWRFSQLIADIAQTQNTSFAPDMAARYVARALALMPDHLRIIEGAADFVQWSKTQAMICVGSNGQRDNVLASLEMAGLRRYFPDETVFTGIEVDNPKPAPDLFMLAARRMGVDPAHCLVIEDSAVGVRAGVAAGMQVFGFTGAHPDSAHQSAVLRNEGATRVFSSFIHMRAFLEDQKAFDIKSSYAS